MKTENLGRYKIHYVLIPVFLYYLYLNLTIPLYADDYWYSLVFGTARHLESLKDIWISQILHYRNWGGRTVAHSIGQLALMGPRQIVVFRFINAAMFTGLNLLIVRISNTHTSSEWKLLLLSFSLFWLFVPRLGETTLWLIGSVNYLWNAFFVILFIYISKSISYDHKLSKFRILIQIFMGLLAGWGFENTSLTGFLLALILLIPGKYRMRQLPGFIAYAVGYIFLIMAPGNNIRAGSIGIHRSLFGIVLDNIPRYLGMHILSWALFLFILVLLIYSYHKTGLKKINPRVYLFLAAGFFNNGLMLASPTIPMRAGFGASVFFIISAVILVAELDLFSKRFFQLFMALLMIIVLIAAVDTGVSYGKLKKLDSERVSIALESIAQGRSSIEWPLADIRFNERVFERDIRTSPYYWVNVHVAEYYGVDAVFGKQPGLQYYKESKIWQDVEVPFGDITLVSISEYRNEDNNYLYFRFQGDLPDNKWESLSFRFRYIDSTTRWPVRTLIKLLPDQFGKFLKNKGDFVSRVIYDGNYIIFGTVVPEDRELLEVEFKVNTLPGSWLWKSEE